MSTRTLAVAVLSILLAGSAYAQSVTLAFHDGLVSIDAKSVPARIILTEWAKKGGTKVVGIERLTGASLTLKLVDVPEAKALETILRSAAGYMAAPRASASVGASVYDRIMVMPTSTAPSPAPAIAARPGTQPANTAFNGTQRVVPPRPTQQVQEPDDQDDPDPNPPSPPVFTFPQPGQQNGAAQTGAFAPVPGGQPYTITVNPQTGAPQTITIAPPQPMPPQPMPTMPAGAATPGVIMAPPQPAQPGTPTRPPGGR